jgi:hypothetical protein
MSEENQYVAGVSVRNPSDFTPKAWYDEMEQQAKAGRDRRIRFRIWEAVAYLGFFIGMLLILKSL